MEWSKAKSMLIALFLILNIVLAASILNRAFDNRSDKEMMSDVLQIIENRGVSLHCSIPTNIAESKLLVCEDNDTFFNAALDMIQQEISHNMRNDTASVVEVSGLNDFHYRFEEQPERITMISIDETDSELRAALKVRGIDLSAFEKDFEMWDEHGNLKIRYVMRFNDSLIFDNEIVIFLNGNGQILEIIGNYREIKSFSENDPMKVIPPYQILLKHYYKPDQVISKIELGFMDQSKESHFIESEEGAVWRIRLEDGTERFFEATYGDEIFVEAGINAV